MRYLGKGENGKKITTEMCFDKVQTRGRPKLVLNRLGVEILESLAQCQLTEEEIAAVFGVSIETLKSKNNIKTFSECKIKGEAYGKASLKRWQFERAKKGSDKMLIWLGKQYLGQKDKLDVAADAEQLDKLDEILSGMTALAEKDEDKGGGVQ